MELTTKCFDGEDWSEVTLEEFLSCDHNLAFNRQTRMLADLSLVGCYKNIFNLTETHLDRYFYIQLILIKKTICLLPSSELCLNRRKKTCQKWGGSVWLSINRRRSIYSKEPFIPYTLLSPFQNGTQLMATMLCGERFECYRFLFSVLGHSVLI